MDKPIENFWQIRLADVKTALEANNFEVFLAEKKEDVHKIVLEDLIPQLKPRTISWGGSMTFTGSGLYKELKDRSDIDVWDTFDSQISDDEKNQRRRQALHADLFITGTNAVCGRAQQNRARSGGGHDAGEKLCRPCQFHAAG
jgi:hypothetical protein